MKKKPLISLIVAMSQNGAIGFNNTIPWKLSADLKRFKKITSGHTVIMGRKTFESLPNGALPNRRNIIISKRLNFNPLGCDVVENIHQSIDLVSNDDEIFIIGGGSIYEQFLPYADKIYLTIIESDFDADVYFPNINFNDWKLIKKEVIYNDVQVNFVYRFEIYKRINK